MGNRAFKIIITAFVGFAILSSILFFVRMHQIGAIQEYQKQTIKISDVELLVEIAKTDSKQIHGLSNRDQLDENKGMLFIYDDSEIRNFWMNDMRFNLDVLWIDDGHVVGMQENIPFEPKNGEISRFQSEIKANMALEVNAGWIAKNGVKIGDMVVVDSN